MLEGKVQQVVINLDGSPETVFVVPIGENCYCLASTPLALLSDIDLYLGDIIEADFHKDGFLYFKRIVEREQFDHTEYGLSQKVVESAEFAQLLQDIETRGEKQKSLWEESFGAIYQKTVTLMLKFA